MRDVENNMPRKSKKKNEYAADNMLVILLVGGAAVIAMLYAFPALLAMFAAKGMRRDNVFEDDQTDNLLLRRSASPNVPTIGMETPLINSKISVLMQDPTTGNALTVYSGFNPSTRSNLIVGQLHNRLNQNLNNAFLLSQYAASDNNPVLIADANGYTCFWNTANDDSALNNPGIKYTLVTPQGNLTYPNQVEFPVNALSAGSKYQVTAAAGANPGSFSAIFQLVQPNGAIDGNDYQMEYRSFQNNVWQGYETQFTMASFYQVSGVPAATQAYNSIFYANPCLVRVGSTEIVIQLFINANSNTATPNPPAPNFFNDIRYIANPSTATNAQGTSLTNAYFPTSASTSLYANVNAKVLPDNSIFVTYLKANVASTAGPFSEYWQRFTLSGTTLTAIGTPQQIKAGNGTPFLIYDTTGPALSLTSTGTDLAVASRHADDVTDQAYTIGFFTNGTIRFNATRLNPYPQQYAETSPTLAVDNTNTIVARWIANPPTGPEVVGVSRTPDMEAVIPLNPAYTEGQPYNFNLAASLPLNLPVGDNTVYTISIPASAGTLFVTNNPLPNNATGYPIVANTNISTTGNTTTLTISAVPGTPLSLMDANTIASTAGFVPTQYSRAQVPVTFTGVSDQYSFNNNYTLANIPVNDNPNVIVANFSAIQGQVQVTNATNLDCFSAHDTCSFVISNTQHCAFILVTDSSIPLFNPGALANYPGTVVTTFTKQQRDAGLIRFWTDGSTTAPSFIVNAVDTTGLQSAPVTVNVPLTLNPAPVVNTNLPTMVINVGGTLVFNMQNLNATQGNTPANQLLYMIAQKVGLNFEYAGTTPNIWVNFPDPNNIQYSQAQVNTGNSIQIMQDPTSTQVSFSYIVQGTWGATSEPINADIVLNQSPVILKSAINYPAVDTWVTLTSNNIYVQDEGPANTDDIYFVSMKEVALRWANTQAALNANDFVTQDDIDNGRVQSSISNAKAMLTVYAKDQYGAVSVPANIQLTINPTTGKSQGTSLVVTISSIVGILGFALTILWRARILYKEKTERYGTSPLGYLLLQAYAKQVKLHNMEVKKYNKDKSKKDRMPEEKPLTIGDFNNASGRQYVDSIAAIATQLQTSGITFSALPQERQQAVAVAIAVYLLSDAGRQYLVKEKVSPPTPDDAGCWESCTDAIDNCLTKTHNVVFTTRELDNNKVRLHAYEIAQGVNTEYRKLLMETVSTLRNSTAKGGGANVEMKPLGDSNSNSGSSDRSHDSAHNMNPW